MKVEGFGYHIVLTSFAEGLTDALVLRPILSLAHGITDRVYLAFRV